LDDADRRRRGGVGQVVYFVLYFVEEIDVT
jgi:hypothetical protein